MVTGKEGTVSTASLYCRFHVQRLQMLGNYAPGFSESFGQTPRALRPECQWRQNRLGQLRRVQSHAEAKIAAFSVFKLIGCLTTSHSSYSSSFPRKRESNFMMDSRFRGSNEVRRSFLNQILTKPYSSKALSHRATLLHPLSTYGLEARAGTSPPFFLQQQRAPP